MSLKSLPVQFSELPISKTFTITNRDLEFLFRYNSRGDFITVEILEEGNIIYTTKLCYGRNIIQGDTVGLPFSIIPLVEDDLYRNEYASITLNKESFDSVKIYFEE